MESNNTFASLRPSSSSSSSPSAASFPSASPLPAWKGSSSKKDWAAIADCDTSSSSSFSSSGPPDLNRDQGRGRGRSAGAADQARNWRNMSRGSEMLAPHCSSSFPSAAAPLSTSLDSTSSNSTSTSSTSSHGRSGGRGRGRGRSDFYSSNSSNGDDRRHHRSDRSSSSSSSAWRTRSQAGTSSASAPRYSNSRNPLSHSTSSSLPEWYTDEGQEAERGERDRLNRGRLPAFFSSADSANITVTSKVSATDVAFSPAGVLLCIIAVFVMVRVL